MRLLHLCLLLATVALSGCSKGIVDRGEPPPGGGDGGTDNDPSFADSELYTPAAQRNLLDAVAHGYFRYYWNDCHPSSKMARIGTQRPDGTVTLGGSAYAVTTLPVAVERGWITYAQGAERFMQVCEFLASAERYHGAWSHWMNGTTGAGLPFNATQQSAGDLVETAFMMTALLVCSEYFKGGAADEVQARARVEQFWSEINWKFYTNNSNSLYWAWDKNLGFAPLKITGPNEALTAYILALAAPAANAITPALFTSGWRGGANYYNKGRTTYGYRFELGKESAGGPLFTSQHPFLWLNPYLLKDQYADYWEFCTNHTLINRHYCLHNAPATYRYDEWNWGLSACYGPPGKDYKGRSPALDDGVLAATAAPGAISVTPFYALQAMTTFNSSIPLCGGGYGVGDNFSRVDNWTDTRYLSISIMPVISIIENYRSGLIWKLAMQNARIARGLSLAGFNAPSYSNGFCQMAVESTEKVVELVANPDTERYTLRYWASSAGSTVSVILTDHNGTKVYTAQPETVTTGINSIEIAYGLLPSGCYTASLNMNGINVSTLNIRLR